MPYIERYEGGGRVLLSNGVRMYHRSFLEYMAEQFPPEDQPKRDIADDDWNVLNGFIDDVVQRQDRTDAKVKRLQDANNLKRAERDTASGRLRSEEPPVRRERDEW